MHNCFISLTGVYQGDTDPFLEQLKKNQPSSQYSKNNNNNSNRGGGAGGVGGGKSKMHEPDFDNISLRSQVIGIINTDFTLT